MLRLSRFSYLWMLVAPLWAPVAWLGPFAVIIVDNWSGGNDRLLFVPEVLLPSLMLWTAAVVIHVSLLALSRRTYMLAFTLGIPVIGLAVVVIFFVALHTTTCNPNNLFGCPSAKANNQIAMAISVAMVILTLPAWCATGVFGIIQVIQERIRRARHSDP